MLSVGMEIDSDQSQNSIVAPFIGFCSDGTNEPGHDEKRYGHYPQEALPLAPSEGWAGVDGFSQVVAS